MARMSTRKGRRREGDATYVGLVDGSPIREIFVLRGLLGSPGDLSFIGSGGTRWIAAVSPEARAVEVPITRCVTGRGRRSVGIRTRRDDRGMD